MNYCARGHFIRDNNSRPVRSAWRQRTTKRCATSSRNTYARPRAARPHGAARDEIGLDRHVLMYSIYLDGQYSRFLRRRLEIEAEAYHESLNEATLANVCALCRAVLRDALEEAAN